MKTRTMFAMGLAAFVLSPVLAQGDKAKQDGKKAEASSQDDKNKRRIPDLTQSKLRPRGVTAKIEISIRRGLDYLKKSQSRDGFWRSAGGYGSYPVAMSALAGTALMCSGSTTTRGPYAVPIRRCVNYLTKNAMRNGLITSLAEESRPMYGHGFSLIFLAQAYGMEEDHTRQKVLHRVLKRGCELVARSQSAAGGWLYAPDDAGDEGSVTITQVQALRACRNSGIAVPIKVIKAAVKYIADCQNPDGGISYSKSSRGSSRPPITAAAVAVLYNAGRYDDPMAEKALKYSQRTLPVSGGSGHHYYAHYYLAQALYQRGGKDWDDYYKKMAAWLLRQQRSDGSWQGDGVGTTYGTSIALTILQLPYANLPIYQR